jgi:MFS family permease
MTGIPLQPPSTASVARRAPILTLLTANAASQTGNMMTAVAVPWFVLVTTGSAARTGIVAAAMALGLIVPAVLGGPLIDRLGYRRSCVLGDVACAAGVAAVPLLYLAGALQFWTLCLLAFALTGLNALVDTAKFALIPPLAQQAGMALERAYAADRAIARMGQLVGPVIAGILIALIEAPNVLFLDAATFVLSGLLVAAGVPRTAVVHPPTGAGVGYLAELRHGLRFVRSDRLILSMVLVATVGNFLDVPLMSVILPVYAQQFFGSSTSLGALIGAFAAGAVLGTVLFGAVARRLPRRPTFIACFIAAPALVYVALALTPPLTILLAVGVVAGMVAGPINPLLLTVIQERTPAAMSGRVFATTTALAQLGIPFGAILAGFAVQGAGLVTTIIGMGTIYLAVTVSLVFNRPLRGMAAGPPAPEEGTDASQDAAGTTPAGPAHPAAPCAGLVTGQPARVPPAPVTVPAERP